MKLHVSNSSLKVSTLDQVDVAEWEDIVMH